ncbi:MAG: 3'(2'),5'-bisphosphate nucleotidase CysQ [Gammaproteobacteria bacterium]|nr:3'(2'),5'-bisphosphate nucleotidase CysQ [Gammaproteobacteria bacterium]
MNPPLLENVVDIAVAAGQAILPIYAQNTIELVHKKDGSPLTVADRLAHDMIISRLSVLTPNIPVLSEESSENDIQERQQWPTLWLVDPLDGTKEFIHRTDEFTVNIALIINHQPVLGVVYAPALALLYYGMDGFGAYKKYDHQIKKIFSRPCHHLWRVVASRRHGAEELDRFLEQLSAYTLVKTGSSLKICLVAEGRADLYPRLSPTSEWDTAAGHAIIKNAGGILCDADYRSFQYNKRDTLLNGPFMVSHRDSPKRMFSIGT